MRWMDDMKVAYKLFLLGIIAVVGLLGTSIAGYMGLRSSQEEDRKSTRLNSSHS